MEENFTLVPAEDIPQPECASLPGTAAEDVPTDTRAASDRRVERFSGDARDDARVPASPEIGSEEGDASGEAPADLPSAMVEDDSRSVGKDRAARSGQPGILDRFAAAQGFSKDGDGRFSHGDGSWIVRARGEVFPWQRHAASGDIVQHYWPKDHCMKQSPLQLEAEVWWLVEKYPESHSLILTDVEGAPIEVTGTELREMRTSEKIVLHPATYRLVYVAGGTAD